MSSVRFPSSSILGLSSRQGRFINPSVQARRAHRFRRQLPGKPTSFSTLHSPVATLPGIIFHMQAVVGISAMDGVLWQTRSSPQFFTEFGPSAYFSGQPPLEKLDVTMERREVRRRLRALCPASPGVYGMLDREGHPLIAPRLAGQVAIGVVEGGQLALAGASRP